MYKRQLSTCLELVWDCLPETISAVVDLSRAAGGWNRAFSGDSRAFLGEFRAVSGFFQAAQGYFQPLQTEKPLALLTRWEGERGPFPGLEQLKNMAVFYPTTAAFLDALLLGEEADLRRGDGQNYASGAVQVMTCLLYTSRPQDRLRRGVLPRDAVLGQPGLRGVLLQPPGRGRPDVYKRQLPAWPPAPCR